MQPLNKKPRASGRWMPQNKSVFSIAESSDTSTAAASATTPTGSKLTAKPPSKPSSVLFSRPGSLTSRQNQGGAFQRAPNALKPKPAFPQPLASSAKANTDQPASLKRAPNAASLTPASNPQHSAQTTPPAPNPMLFGAALHGPAAKPDAALPAANLSAAFGAAQRSQLQEDTAQRDAVDHTPAVDGNILQSFDAPAARLSGQPGPQAPPTRGLASGAPRLQYRPTEKVVAHGANEVTAYLKAFPSRFHGGTGAGRCSVAEAAAAGATDKRTADIKKLLDDSAPEGEQRSEVEQQARVLAEGFLAAACLSTKRVLAKVFAQATADIQEAAEARMATSRAQVSMLQVCPGAGDALSIHQMALVEPADPAEAETMHADSCSDSDAEEDEAA